MVHRGTATTKSQRARGRSRSRNRNGGGRPTAGTADTLGDLATGLLRLLIGPRSIALNRAAMGSPDLAALVLQHGRHAVGPLVERWLTRLHTDGRLHVPDRGRSFQVLYGLVVPDAWSWRWPASSSSKTSPPRSSTS